MNTSEANPAQIAARQAVFDRLLDSIIRPTDTPADVIAWLIAVEQACDRQRQKLAAARPRLDLQ